MRNLKKNSIFSAFTLAEIMIVIAVIGVFVAILLPSARNATPDENFLKYKKSSSSMLNAIRELVFSEQYYSSGDLGIKADGALVNSAQHFCNSLGDILNVRNLNCSDNNQGVPLINFPDLVTKTINGTSVYDYVDCVCKNNTNSGAEIILNNNSIIYTVNPALHFGSMTQSGAEVESRLFNLCSSSRRYKIICLDIDGIDNGEDPFGYALRADGTTIQGSRALAWNKKSVQIKDDEDIPISSTNSCPSAISISSIAPEDDTCNGGGNGENNTEEESDYCYTFDGNNICNKYAELKVNGTYIPNKTVTATIYLVGGGGAGGASYGKGGDGGAVETQEITLSAGTEYTVTIGAGGSGGTGQGGNGGDTFFDSHKAAGGAGGLKNGGDSGGGSSTCDSNPSNVAKGRAGCLLTINGSTRCFGGGGSSGNGGVPSTADGIDCGGGRGYGASNCTKGEAGDANTGGGGGAGGERTSPDTCAANGGNGGSGIVIVVVK